MASSSEDKKPLKLPIIGFAKLLIADSDRIVKQLNGYYIDDLPAHIDYNDKETSIVVNLPIADPILYLKLGGQNEYLRMSVWCGPRTTSSKDTTRFTLCSLKSLDCASIQNQMEASKSNTFQGEFTAPFWKEPVVLNATFHTVEHKFQTRVTRVEISMPTEIIHRFAEIEAHFKDDEKKDDEKKDDEKKAGK
eukprot:CAMPEP_0113846514 /NCGR_PEP_ID=MMETSP0372-20130328/1348_1 /TAXON_ID=340204 /ORGANISM="Lankesteria abbotti" /LENGTH=191 /DNA_ID=CAMNT_0000815663 /DNA_START=129 /DNA_END=704 /DNA_ORIENTATION=+ /assembly_acc=CAM_ASM_000359